jgi:hypothetical protein
MANIKYLEKAVLACYLRNLLDSVRQKLLKWKALCKKTSVYNSLTKGVRIFGLDREMGKAT